MFTTISLFLSTVQSEGISNVFMNVRVCVELAMPLVADVAIINCLRGRTRNIFFLSWEASGGQWLLWPGLSLVWLAGSRWSYDKARGISYWQSYVGGVGTHLAHKESILRYTLIPLHSLVNTDTLFVASVCCGNL